MRFQIRPDSGELDSDKIFTIPKLSKNLEIETTFDVTWHSTCTQHEQFKRRDEIMKLNSHSSHFLIRTAHPSLFCDRDKFEGQGLEHCIEIDLIEGKRKSNGFISNETSSNLFSASSFKQMRT